MALTACFHIFELAENSPDRFSRTTTHVFYPAYSLHLMTNIVRVVYYHQGKLQCLLQTWLEKLTRIHCLFLFFFSYVHGHGKFLLNRNKKDTHQLALLYTLDSLHIFTDYFTHIYKVILFGIEFAAEPT